MSTTCINHLKDTQNLTDAQKTVLAFLNPVETQNTNRLSSEEPSYNSDSHICAFNQNSADIFGLVGNTMNIPADLYWDQRSNSVTYNLDSIQANQYPVNGSVIPSNNISDFTNDAYIKLYENDIKYIHTLCNLINSYTESNKRYLNSNNYMVNLTTKIIGYSNNMVAYSNSLVEHKNALMNKLMIQQAQFKVIKAKYNSVLTTYNSNFNALTKQYKVMFDNTKIISPLELNINNFKNIKIVDYMFQEPAPEPKTARGFVKNNNYYTNNNIKINNNNNNTTNIYEEDDEDC